MVGVPNICNNVVLISINKLSPSIVYSLVKYSSADATPPASSEETAKTVVENNV